MDYEAPLEPFRPAAVATGKAEQGPISKMRVVSKGSRTGGTASQEPSGALRVGVDIVEIGRLRVAVERWGERFLGRIYTGGELAYSRGRAPQLAARFAAKEATMKALGTGRRGVGWRDVEVYNEPGGAPSLKLHGRAAQRACALGIEHFAISISHSRDYAVAFVVTVRREAS